MISLVLVLSGITEGFDLLTARASRLFFLGGGTIFHAILFVKRKEKTEDSGRRKTKAIKRRSQQLASYIKKKGKK